MTYRFGEFELDEERRQLRCGMSLVSLQPLIFNLIALLVREHGRVVTKGELLDALWPDVTVTEASIQRAISVARATLKDESHELIRTFTSYGYRFCGEVQVGGTPGEELAPGPSALPEQARRIQYATTRDGVSIAYWTLGTGPPLVYVPNVIWSHARLEWEFPEVRRWYDRISRNRMVVRLDLRGTGASERHVEQYSYPALQLDLLAVVEKLGLERFALLGDLNAGPVVLRFAAEHPERVSRLVLWHSYANRTDIQNPKQMIFTLDSLIERDWETFTELRAHMGFGWLDGASAHRYAAFLRECASPEITRASYEAGLEDDVSALVPEIAVPVLILHRRQFVFWDVQVSQRLAARMQDARLVILEGAASAPFLGDWDEAATVIDAFLSEADE